MNLSKIKSLVHSAAHYALNGGALLYTAAQIVSTGAIHVSPQVATASAIVLGVGNLILKNTTPKQDPAAGDQK